MNFFKQKCTSLPRNKRSAGCTDVSSITPEELALRMAWMVDALVKSIFSPEEMEEMLSHQQVNVLGIAHSHG